MSQSVPDGFGCGSAANRIVYRGQRRRLFACEDCIELYKGKGKPHPYATETPGKPGPEGHHVGPAKRCGEQVE